MGIQNKFRRALLLVLMTLLSALSACVSSPSSDTGVQRVAADEVYDLTGKWNDIDSQLIADKMIESVLSAGWLGKWSKSELPIVIVGNVRNNTSEHIDTRLFVKDLEAELINSGQITLVASSLERLQIRDEREDQQSNASEITMKRIAQETGADFMLIGSIDYNVEETGATKVIYYLVSMELIDVESNVKAWVDTEPIKKVINKSVQSRSSQAPPQSDRRNGRGSNPRPERHSSDW
ncbi:penicillin-binding protein activator LpoB [Candidatus Haliotispira prima]|uniref:Penicillin-binding protein activator LpoB n=1 Tax=Candidatus Haliotispira prima TaxID=3034016 RepID=A0ABY8MDY5_9SPIO|nr:penicillin-binding protein activator LpoB [Candidatus Haliotispira prima]